MIDDHECKGVKCKLCAVRRELDDLKADYATLHSFARGVVVNRMEFSIKLKEQLDEFKTLLKTSRYEVVQRFGPCGDEVRRKR
jgi:hypothetical protein